MLRILILSIPDLGSNKKFVVLFFVATNFPKFKIILLILANSQRIFGVFSQKYGLGTGIRDLGSEIQKKPIPDPGSRSQKGTRSRIRIRNTGVYQGCGYGSGWHEGYKWRCKGSADSLLMIRIRFKTKSPHHLRFQCCGSGMFIPGPGSWFLPIPDPGSKNSNKRERWKKLDVKPFYVATKFF